MKDFGLFDSMVRVQNFRSLRASSWDRSGGNEDWAVIKADGGKAILLEENSAGCINHIYWTFVHDDDHGDAEILNVRNNVFRGFVFRAFWDNSEIPSIEVPLGDLFGVCNGQFRPVRSLAFTANTGARGREDHATWGFNCYLPMPFHSGCRLEIVNEGNYDGRIWYHIDYELFNNSSCIPENAGLLHAFWNRENPTKPEKLHLGRNLSGKGNYKLLDIKGKGQLVGYFLTVVNLNPTWWGEGDDMIFIDGEEFPPSIHGTGSEEIFGGGACPDEEYTGPYTGFHCIENRSGYRWYGVNGMYRFFITDPVRFRSSIKVTVEHGHANDLANEYCSVAFWYQDQVNINRAELLPVAERQITNY